MTSTTNPSTVTPRKSLQRTLAYRQIIEWIYIGINYAAIAGVCGTILVAGLLWTTEDDSVLYILSLNSILIAAISLFNFFIVRPFYKVRVHVSPNNISLEKKGQVKVIEFKDIKNIHFRSLPYFGSNFVLNTNSGKFTFSSFLERSDYILETLMNQAPELISQDSITKYRINTIASDHSWARAHSRLNAWAPLVLKIVLAGFLLTLGGYLSEYFHPSENGVAPEFWFTLFSLNIIYAGMISYAVWLVEDYSLIRKKRKDLEKDSTSVRRDMELESRFQKKFTLINILVVLAISVVITIK